MITGYSDADWGSENRAQKSISGYVYFLSEFAFSWRSRLRGTVAQSSSDVEFVALSHAIRRALRIKKVSFVFSYVHTIHVETDKIVKDTFTMALPTPNFHRFVHILGLISLEYISWGEVLKAQFTTWWKVSIYISQACFLVFKSEIWFFIFSGDLQDSLLDSIRFIFVYDTQPYHSTYCSTRNRHTPIFTLLGSFGWVWCCYYKTNIIVVLKHSLPFRVV